MFLYGFDDLARAQLELVDALSAAGEVTVAVTFADRRALSVRAGLISVLREELGASTEAELPFDDGYTESAALLPPRPQPVRARRGADRRPTMAWC